MTVRIPMVVHAVLSRQDLVDDSISYELDVSVLNVQMRIPCSPMLIERIDMHIRGDIDSAPQAAATSSARRAEAQITQQQQRVRQVMSDLDNYEVGVVDGYDD